MVLASHPKPAGLSIARDANGVPHISADRFDDTMWGIGYCHATDRTTQILMMRALGQGRVCELLSDSDESLLIDKFFRRANWHNNIEQQIELLDDDTQAWFCLCGILFSIVAAGVTGAGLVVYLISR